MTEIKPFKAVFYNREKIKDLSKVVCPPYDVISSKEQNNFYNSSEYNFVRVLLAKDKLNDSKQDNRYTRSKETYERWLKEGVLQQDEKPCIYFYRQEYKVMGEKHSRVGFISLMRLQDEKNSKVFPHENTHTHAKEDRLKLWKMLGTNLSAIFVCYSDKEKKVKHIYDRHVSTSDPVIDIKDSDGVRHILWRLDDQDLIKEIVKSVANQQIFIADGHHRFEVASELRKLKARGSKLNGQDPYNFVMTYFTNIDSRDLKIFPMHRIIKKLPQDVDFLEEFFRIDKIKTKEQFLVLLAKAGRNEHAFGMYTRSGMRLLRLKNKLLIDKVVKEGSADYKRLDATILKSFILDRVGVKSEDIIYTQDSLLATSMVDEHKADAAFIMNPVKIQQLKNIALNGERMPPKTTYFYPKLLSGLTIYHMS